jgi:hypothetical protein
MCVCLRLASTTSSLSLAALARRSSCTVAGWPTSTRGLLGADTEAKPRLTRCITESGGTPLPLAARLLPVVADELPLFWPAVDVVVAVVVVVFVVAVVVDVVVDGAAVSPVLDGETRCALFQLFESRIILVSIVVVDILSVFRA